MSRFYGLESKVTHAELPAREGHRSTIYMILPELRRRFSRPRSDHVVLPVPAGTVKEAIDRFKCIYPQTDAITVFELQPEQALALAKRLLGQTASAKQGIQLSLSAELLQEVVALAESTATESGLPFSGIAFSNPPFSDPPLSDPPLLLRNAARSGTSED